MKKRHLFWILSAVISGRLFAAGSDAANTNSNPRVRALLSYFQSLEARSDKRVLSGQFVNFGNGANLTLMNRIHSQTGLWPAIIGVDYADFGKGALTFEVPNRTAIDYSKAGGIVTVSAHLYNPANPNRGGLRDKGVDLKTLLESGSETHTRWMAELDQLAGGLQQLKDAGVVVLWRPFHEMNGDWFWWGGQDPKTFVQLWRQMFDYFTQVKGLDNLLWVYGPNHGAKTADYYPGERYVDLVGLDAYTDFIDPEHIKGYPEVARLGKPFGLSEFGPHGASNPPGDYDYRRLISGIQTNFPKTVFFMSWNANWSLARNTNVTEFLSHPWIANREDIPKSATSAP